MTRLLLAAAAVATLSLSSAAFAADEHMDCSSCPHHAEKAKEGGSSKAAAGCGCMEGKKCACEKGCKCNHGDHKAPEQGSKAQPAK